ncbi:MULTISPECIES: hypothetical protein [Halomonadaceae]|uniref:hypothetical protein n=1 Tax=Halomonadaceae TaxID=28256 RepID=UPI0012F18E14|nr:MULTISPECIES: hypothetical protein [Halomonas]CAD5264501.1 conserved hypothetical protein [Halomonas sp. 156]CAD5265677.1 conserved hypothetical protein [Halomonas sp. I3]CAD5284138.1 conserved hypothetical protein [Halomonas sp. 113]CAD5285601.1 conserved hypothetical protein [Halomonas sp. 59]VXC33202.1 conserved hypothetical protein [Halomonas titanicae]
MGKKKRKVKYDVTETLRFKLFSPEYEELTKDLYASACKGTEHLWDKINGPEDLRSDTQLKKDFYEAANNGMKSAQDGIIAIIQSKDKLDYPKELLLRGIADAIAWQILGGQLCHARRFFKSGNQPDLYNCNLDSVVYAAKENHKKNPRSISLISDLTSFIQVGDLLVCDPEKGITIAEVKEGAMNAKIFGFMEFYMKSKCDRAFYYFAQQEGDKAVKQLKRIIRQESRMSYVTTVLATGQGVDPDTSEKINIPEPYFEIQSWDERLVKTLDKADEKGWAIDVIDGCVFLGVYASEHMLMSGHVIFNSWFDSSGGTPDCPRALLIDSMLHPLALPVFSRNLPEKHMFDVLFGRKQVCMAICIESLLKQCEKAGLSVRFATNKERGRLDKTGNRPYRHKGEAIFIGNGKAEFALMDGIFLRVMFHGQSPISLIISMIEGTDEII